MAEPAVIVSLNISCTTDSEALRAFEALGRAATGLAFDGMFASVAISRVDDESGDGS